MVNLRLNGIDVQAEEGQTLLEVCRFYGIPIPTLCYNEGLTPLGACRLCVVEIGSDPQKSRLVTSCTYPVEEGLEVRTHSKRVIKARKMLIELLVAVTILAMILMIMSSIFHSSTVAWDAGMRKAHGNMSARAALGLMALGRVRTRRISQLPGAQLPDQPGPEQEADQQRRHQGIGASEGEVAKHPEGREPFAEVGIEMIEHLLGGLPAESRGALQRFDHFLHFHAPPTNRRVRFT